MSIAQSSSASTATATIPALETLRPGRQWVCFNQKKIPYNPLTLKPVQGELTEGSDEWASYEETVAAWQSHDKWIRGIGREFVKGQRITGIDLDKCFDEQGNLTPYARYVVGLINSYTEKSPSERGLHIWAYGEISDNIGPDPDGISTIEMYDNARYFTWTGNHLEGTPTTIEERYEQVQSLFEETQAIRQQVRQRKSPSITSPKNITQCKGDSPYGLAALSGECAAMAQAREGGRNHQLNTSAYALGQLIAGNELAQSTAENALSEAAANVGLDNREIEKTLRSGIDAGMKEPRSAPAESQPQADAPGEQAEKTAKPEKEKEDSQALKLVKMALEEAELFSTSKGERYARLTINGRVETLIITEKGGAFKRWLIHRYLSETGNIPNATALSSAIGVLEAEAQFGNRPQREVYIRLAYHRGKLYLDLANTQCEVVEVSSQGWKIINDAPVEFRRPNGMLPLPRPVNGGKLDDLRPFVNISQDDWILCLAWLVGSLHPTGPYPILDLNSERGSAKSTTTKVLRSLIDPSKAPLRKEPKDDQTFAIMAYNNYVVAFDNLSHISTRMSDNMCTLATGAGDAYRSLYTNDEEHIFDARRPQVFNGIEELATRGDLIDRCIILKLPEIEKAKRRDERTFWNEFNQAHPRILGALLDAVSIALKNLPHTRLAETPRMADFALWVQAAESALTPKTGAFLEAYEKNREEGIATEIEASPIGSAVLALMKDAASYDGLASDLLKSLKTKVDEEITQHKSWPQNARALSGQLRRLTPSLRSRQIYILQKRTNEGSNITITSVAKITEECSKSDAKSAESDANLPESDANFPTLRHYPSQASSGFDPLVTQNVANNGLHSISCSQEKREEEREEGTDRNMGENLRHFASLTFCATTFESLMSSPHGKHEATLQDAAGNWWCADCQMQADLMNIGQARGYLAFDYGHGIKSKQGHDAWLIFCRTMGYTSIRRVLEVQP